MSVNIISVSNLNQFSTRQLRAMIKQRTAEVNIQISQYREFVSEGKQKESKATNNMIERMKRAAGTKSGKRGEVGLGLTYKRKEELVAQYNLIQKFLAYDLSIPAHAEQQTERIEKSRATWQKRYGYISKEDFAALSYDMSAVASALSDYGYEDIGGEIAENYQKASNKGRKNFLKYVLKARDNTKSLGRPATPEDIIDQLISVMKEDDAFS